jgi:hypothetical protein
MTQELSTVGTDLEIDGTLERFQEEINYLSNLVRKLEVENYELRQELQLMELLIQDLQIGIPKGDMN